jgi:hypothetical protein
MSKSLDAMSITDLKDFANWLKRESARDDCNHLVLHTYRKATEGPARNAVRQCAGYLPEYWREKGLGYKTEHEKKCDEKARKLTNDFYDAYARREPRHQGKDHFCGAVEEYFKRPEWNYAQCMSQIEALQGGRPGRGSATNLTDVIKPATFASLCPYIEGAIERAIQFQDRLEEIEGKDVARKHDRYRWIQEASRDFPAFVDKLDRKIKLEMKYEKKEPYVTSTLLEQKGRTGVKTENETQQMVNLFLPDILKQQTRQQRVDMVKGLKNALTPEQYTLLLETVLEAV